MPNSAGTRGIHDIEPAQATAVNAQGVVNGRAGRSSAGPGTRISVSEPDIETCDSYIEKRCRRNFQTPGQVR